MKKLSLKMLVLSLLTAALPAFAQDYNPRALTQVVESVHHASLEGKTPVVLFDLDDTLIDTRERNLRIIHDFAKEPQAVASGNEMQKLASLRESEVRFQMTDTLAGIGIETPSLVKAVSDFWLQRFFTNEFSAADHENPGAARYVQEILRAGGKVVYLTGRDAPRMHEGTVASLRAQGFPLNDTTALLLMKPDKSIDDLQFKKDSFAQVGAMGEMEGVFENEPANINAMADAFPGAIAIFLDTIHSPTQIVPEARVNWVADFREPAEEGCAASW